MSELLDDAETLAAEERGPSSSDAPPAAVVRADRDVFVKVNDSQLVLYRAGQRIASAHVDLPQLQADRESGALVPGNAVRKKSRRGSQG